MDARLDENEAELGVLVAAVTLEVLADGHGLLDKHVQVLGDLGGETCIKGFRIGCERFRRRGRGGTEGG